MEPVLANLTCTALSPESHPWAPQRQSYGEGQENGIILRLKETGEEVLAPAIKVPNQTGSQICKYLTLLTY